MSLGRSTHPAGTPSTRGEKEEGRKQHGIHLQYTTIFSRHFSPIDYVDIQTIYIPEMTSTSTIFSEHHHQLLLSFHFRLLELPLDLRTSSLFSSLSIRTQIVGGTAAIRRQRGGPSTGEREDKPRTSTVRGLRPRQSPRRPGGPTGRNRESPRGRPGEEPTDGRLLHSRSDVGEHTRGGDPRYAEELPRREQVSI